MRARPWQQWLVLDIGPTIILVGHDGDLGCGQVSDLFA
jgi:hypothetical protein